MSNNLKNKEIQIVRPCDWYGAQGWCCDGWAGETKEEAVMEMCIRDADGDVGVASDRLQNIQIVEES